MVSQKQCHQFLKLIPSTGCPLLHQFLHQLEHRGDMPHLITIRFLRRKELGKQKNNGR